MGKNHNLNFVNENHKVLDEFIENNNLNKFIANDEYLDYEILNRQIHNEEYSNNRINDNYYQEQNEEEEQIQDDNNHDYNHNHYNEKNKNYQEDEAGEYNENEGNQENEENEENEENQYYEENENYDEENNNQSENQNHHQESFLDQNTSRRNESIYDRISNSNNENNNVIDISKIDIHANSLKTKSKNHDSKPNYYENKTNLVNNNNLAVDYAINRSKIKADEISDKLKSNKINLDAVDEISNNNKTLIAPNNLYENLTDKFIFQPLSKENQGHNYRNAANFIDNPINNKIKINLVECSKEELDLIEKLLNNKSIKIENEDYFRKAKNELILKLETISLMNKENKDLGFNIHNHPLKKETFLNEKEKFIYMDIINFKGVLNKQVQEKNEKDFEINNLKDIIKTLNNQLASKDQVIKNSMEISNKYNDLLKEFYNLQELQN